MVTAQLVVKRYNEIMGENAFCRDYGQIAAKDIETGDILHHITLAAISCARWDIERIEKFVATYGKEK